MILHLSLLIIVAQHFDETTVTTNLAKTVIAHTLARILFSAMRLQSG
jgi:hypothetical protein